MSDTSGDDREICPKTGKLCAAGCDYDKKITGYCFLLDPAGDHRNIAVAARSDEDGVTSDRIERAAKAAFESMRGIAHIGESWDSRIAETQERYRVMVRAAIEAGRHARGGTQHDGESDMYEERFDPYAADERAKTRKLLRALKETILNLESVCDQADLAIRRARERLAEFEDDDDDEADEC